MKEKKAITKKVTTLIVSLALVAALLPGCSSTVEAETAGHLTMKVNPQIEIFYNQEGKVAKLEAGNSDGAKVIKGYDPLGRELEDVVEDLIERINKGGYIDASKTITLSLEEGSAILKDDFLIQLEVKAKEKVSSLGLTNDVVMDDDWDDDDDRDDDDSRDDDRDDGNRNDDDDGRDDDRDDGNRNDDDDDRDDDRDDGNRDDNDDWDDDQDDGNQNDDDDDWNDDQDDGNDDDNDDDQDDQYDDNDDDQDDQGDDDDQDDD